MPIKTEDDLLRYHYISDCHMSIPTAPFDGTRNMRDMCMNAIEMGLVYYRCDRPLRVRPCIMNVPHISGGRYYDVVRQSYAELLQNQERCFTADLRLYARH